MRSFVFLGCLLIVLDGLIIAVGGFYGSLHAGKSYGCIYVVGGILNVHLCCLGACHAVTRIL